LKSNSLFVIPWNVLETSFSL